MRICRRAQAERPRREKHAMTEREETARRVTVNLRPSDVERIEEIAEQTSLTANEIIRRALATESFVIRTLKDGRKVLTEDSEGRLREVQFVR
jgi:Ribbon-helix-helix protein, copG family